jgi:hypothetical protein
VWFYCPAIVAEKEKEHEQGKCSAFLVLVEKKSLA